LLNHTGEKFKLVIVDGSYTLDGCPVAGFKKRCVNIIFLQPVLDFFRAKNVLYKSIKGKVFLSTITQHQIIAIRNANLVVILPDLLEK